VGRFEPEQSSTLYSPCLLACKSTGTMAGYTGFSVGLLNNKMCLLPIPELVATSPRQMDARGRTWERILGITRQPNTVETGKRSKTGSILCR